MKRDQIVEWVAARMIDDPAVTLKRLRKLARGRMNIYPLIMGLARKLMGFGRARTRRHGPPEPLAEIIARRGAPRPIAELVARRRRA